MPPAPLHAGIPPAPAPASPLASRTTTDQRAWRLRLPDPSPPSTARFAQAGARLFSSSLTEFDLDNLICHSCDPNCDVVIGADLAAGLVARRPIPAGSSITFDYDTTEEDLRGDRGGFTCHCGAANCRGEVLGGLFSPKPKA